MIATVSRPLAVISTIAWLLTLGLSVAELAGIRLPSRTPEVLLVALFPLYLGAIVALSFGMKNTPFTEPSWFRRAVDRAPQWAKYAVWGSATFAIITAAAALIFRGQMQGSAGSGVYVMLFSLPVLVFSTTSISLDCPKGHVVGPFEQYCRTCGAPISDNWQIR